MSHPVIEIGDKFHIQTRRLFDEEVRRHFVGEVVALGDGLVELRGFTFIFKTGHNEYRRLPEVRTRIFSLGDSGYIVNKIPREVRLEQFAYRTVDNRVVITDGAAFSLPINEFGPAN